MQKIYLHTPYYNGSGYIPHLVEHCANKPRKNMKDSDFFSYMYDADAINVGEITYFTIPPSFEIDTYIDFLSQKISVETIQYEQKVLSQELSSGSRTAQLIYQTRGKKLYGKNFSVDTKGKISLTDVQKYHQKHYTSEHMLVVDEWNIIYAGATYTYINSYEIPSILSVSKKNYVINKERMYGTIISYTSWGDLVLTHFMDMCISARNQYSKRWLAGEYFYDDGYWMIYPEHIVLSRYDDVDVQISKDFFEDFKKYFLQTAYTSYGKKAWLYHAIVRREVIEQDLVKKYISSLSYDVCMSII